MQDKEASRHHPFLGILKNLQRNATQLQEYILYLCSRNNIRYETIRAENW